MLIKSYFKEYLDFYPSLGSFIGQTKYNSRFENYIDDTFSKRVFDMNKRYLSKLKNVDSIDNDILQWVVTTNIEIYKLPFDLMPLTLFHNIIINFSFINLRQYPLKTEKDIKDLVSRHEDFIKVIRSCKRKMKKGMAKGYVLPKTICKKMLISMKEYYNSQEYIIDVPSQYAGIWLPAAKKYGKAVLDMIQFIDLEYYPACRSSIGLCDLPDGRKLYEFCVKSELSMNMDIAEIHQYGLSEIERISAEMEKIKTDLGYENFTLQQFYKEMIRNPAYQIKTAEELLKAYKQKREEIRSNIIPKYFEHKVGPYEIEAVPEDIQKTSAAAFYISATKQKKGTFYINLLNLQDNFAYSIAPLSLHEGEPGHHYQCQYMLDKKLPPYRIFLVTANAFIEGWGLYAETFIDPSDKIDYFGKLTFELYRAARLVVDTGIHYYGWSYQKCIKYMQHNVPLGKQQIEAEIDRYICLPGQALCYKIGEREILKWKHLFTSKFGTSDESLKRFHTIMLEDGNLPLQVLEKKMQTILR